MSEIFNLGNVKFSEKKSSVPEYSWSFSEDLAKIAGMKDFCCNIRSLAQGDYSYPYHFHHNAEELFVILDGNGLLRTPDGISNVKNGDVILCERGSSGAHQLHNPNSKPLVYLDLRTVHEADICEYPDTGKVNILPQQEIFYRGDSAEYFEGEDGIGGIWSRLVHK